MKRFKTASIVIVLIFTIIALSGCGGGSKVDVEKVREYSDPITEEMLSALNEGDYVKFSKHFDETMKGKFTQDAFNECKEQFKAKIGDYKSKEYYGIDTKDKYTIVLYRCKYTNEPKDALVRVVFSTSDDKHYVSGFFINSPNLAK
jgi:hypothetical protein